jgi:hypothetical protein
MKFQKIGKTVGVLRSFSLRLCLQLSAAATGLALFGVSPAFADDAVQLKVLVVSTGSETQDQGLEYIKPVLDEMGVPYDVLDASATSLTAATLSPNGCEAITVGCVGNYNGIILTGADLGLGFTPSEWEILHQYEKDFHVHEAVLSGWPAQYWDPNPPWGIYLDYGLAVSGGGTFPHAQWTGPVGGPTVFEYVNAGNPLPVTDWAFAAMPRNDGIGPRDGTVPSVEPLLTTANGDALISIVRYYLPGQPTTPVREVLLSTITNAWYLIHSQVLAYEFINFATQGVFVGGRHVFMTAHLDDLFIADELWDADTNKTDPNNTYRLNSYDINNAVAVQNTFRAAHPTVGNGFMLDFAFNGAGAVVDPQAAKKNLVADLTEDLVAAVVANKIQFRFINHTFSHADMDEAPEPPDAPCDYPTFTNLKDIKQEITKNRKVWSLLGLPQKSNNNRILVSGNHSGLKDRNCTDYPELHPEMNGDVQADDIPFPDGANPLFLEAAADVNVDYLAADASQANQNIEQYISQVNDGSNQDRILLPRWPANVFYNTINPDQLVDEYNYIFYERYANSGQDPCAIPGAICQPRDYGEILAAESDMALRHMLSFRKWPHYFHQTNLAKYDGAGSTLQFDWLNAVFDEYEKLLNLPVSNYPYFLIGDNTQERLIARSAIIQATWNRMTNQVTLSANKSVPNLLVTGLQGGDLYGGQFIREINVNTTPKTIGVDQALTQ